MTSRRCAPSRPARTRILARGERHSHAQLSRATFKTWLSRIAANRARTRAAREGRSIPFSAFVQDETDGSEQAVDPARFQSADGRYPGHWLLKPLTDGLPEERVLAGELVAMMRDAVAGLPSAQSQVVRLRDIEGLSSEEVCQVLQLTEGNQRVLLHRGRSKLRAVLEGYVTTRSN